MIWKCKCTAVFIIGQYFFLKMWPINDLTCSIYTHRYQYISQAYVILTIKQRSCLQESIFIQDVKDAIIKDVTVIRSLKLLRRTFIDIDVISQCFPTPWLPRLSDLTPCGFWLWRYFKDNVYRRRLITVTNLNNIASHDNQNIHVDSLRSAVENVILN